jgi:tRNA A37 threonylcarbamoyladenosine modification protein TsaB
MKQIIAIAALLLSANIMMAQPPAGDAKKGDVYGEKFESGKVISTENLQKNLTEGKTVEGQVKGKVVEVCANKGCWIKLQLADKSIATVKMKDYSFFVPTALTGKTIAINGKVEKTTTSVKELQHLAEDAKKTPEEIEAINTPKEEIKITANSIKVVD